MCRRGHFSVRVRRNQSTSVHVHVRVRIRTSVNGVRGTDVKYSSTDRWWGCITLSRFQWHNQCATLGLHVVTNQLSIILVLPNTVVVWLQFLLQLDYARSWCKKFSYTLAWSDSVWYTGTYLLLVSISQIVSSIKMRLAGSNSCVVAKQHGWKYGSRMQGYITWT